MDNNKRVQKFGNIALGLGAVALLILVLTIAIELNATWLGNFIVASLFFAALGCGLGVYSLSLKRTARGFAAVLIGLIPIFLFTLLLVLFRDFCVVC